MNGTQENIRPEEFPSQALEVIDWVLKCIPADPERNPQEFLIHLYAANLKRLGEDVVFLEAHERSASTTIIARGMTLGF
jgi:hypothetical protein